MPKHIHRPERNQVLPELLGVFESNVNLFRPMEARGRGPRSGFWPHSALLCRTETA